MDYQTYEKQLLEPYEYKPIDISIGFYALCSFQPQAWDYVFETIRKYYPTEPIVLINDGMDQFDYSEMAIKYNCIHIKKDKNICLLWNDTSDAYEFLNRTKEACNLVNTEWLIHLHPDVICQCKISYFPPSDLCGVSAGSKTGKSNNNFSISPKWNEIEKYIRKYNPIKSDIEINGWGWCGGSIMKIDTFYRVYDNILTKNEYKLENIKNIYIESMKYEDTMIPILFTLSGYPYRIWKDNPEYHRNNNSIKGAFLHGYKEHYEFHKLNQSLESFNKSRIEYSMRNINT